MHLSCTVSQDKDPPLTSNHETSRCTSTKPAIEVEETQREKTKSHIKTIKKDTLTLSQADVEEAIELSIAASEAMVITEMISLDLSNTSPFSVCDVLEATLQVKEARRQMLENGSGASLEQDGDESDSLPNLDEYAMVAAYADVGFSDKWAPDSNSNTHSLGSCDDYTLVPCSMTENTCTPEIFNFRNPSPKEENAAAIESEKQGLDMFGGIEKNLKEAEDNLEVNPVLFKP